MRQVAVMAYNNDVIWLAFAILACIVLLFFVRMPVHAEA